MKDLAIGLLTRRGTCDGAEVGSTDIFSARIITAKWSTCARSAGIALFAHAGTRRRRLFH